MHFFHSVTLTCSFLHFEHSFLLIKPPASLLFLTSFLSPLCTKSTRALTLPFRGAPTFARTFAICSASFLANSSTRCFCACFSARTAVALNCWICLFDSWHPCEIDGLEGKPVVCCARACLSGEILSSAREASVGIDAVEEVGEEGKRGL